MNSSKQSVIGLVSGLSTKTNLQSCCCFSSIFRGATRSSLSLLSTFGLSHKPRPRICHSLINAWCGELLWCGWCLASFLTSHLRCYGRKHWRIRGSISSIEISVHLKVQSSALSCSAHTSSHFGVHVQTSVAYHNMFLPSTNSLSFKLALNWCSVTTRC